jgi:hypothetical protein
MKSRIVRLVSATAQTEGEPDRSSARRRSRLSCTTDEDDSRGMRILYVMVISPNMPAGRDEWTFRRTAVRKRSRAAMLCSLANSVARAFTWLVNFPNKVS